VPALVQVETIVEVAVAEVTTAVVVYVLVEDEEDEVLLLLVFKVPPTGPPGGEVEVVAFLARVMNASRVLPVVGALMAPTMPDWQWLPTV